MSDKSEPKRVAFLGPEGTFSEHAAAEYIKRYAPNAELISYPTISTAAEAQTRKKTDWAVVPYENSTGGGVGETHSFLIHNPNVQIRGEVVIPIEQCLILQMNETRADVKVIFSHEQALNQCQRRLAQDFPSVQLELSPSTADAINLAHKYGAGAAAIAPRRAQELYGGRLEQAGFEDEPNNHTRFIVLASEQFPRRTGNDRTTLDFSTYNTIGALHSVLGQFVDNEINLIRIESRPRPGRLGDYLFFVDFDGHSEDEKVKKAYKAIRDLPSTKRFYHRGSYPRAAPLAI